MTESCITCGANTTLTTIKLGVKVCAKCLVPMGHCHGVFGGVVVRIKEPEPC